MKNKQPKSKQRKELELSIVMPCLNEAETLQTCIEKANTFLKTNQIQGEVVIGDNGSTDGSLEIAETCGARVIHVPVRGYGAALFHATLEARGKFVIMADSDDSYDFLRLEGILEKLREGYDLVMGNRFAGGILPGAMPWKNRFIGNPVLSFIGRLFFRVPVKDFHCGLRGFRKEAFEKMDLQTTGMEYASEMVMKATLNKMKITEVPVKLHPDGRSRKPHLRPFRDGWRHLKFMLLYSPRWLFLYPGSFLLLAGIAGLLWLFPHSQKLGSLTLDIHSMLYAGLGILAGLQLVITSILMKEYTIQRRLLPADRYTSFLRTKVSPESIMLLGLLILIGGFLFFFFALQGWQASGFGEMQPADTMRLAIPSVVLILSGFQIFLAAWILALFRIKTKDSQRPDFTRDS